MGATTWRQWLGFAIVGTAAVAIALALVVQVAAAFLTHSCGC